MGWIEEKRGRIGGGERTTMDVEHTLVSGENCLWQVILL